MSLFSFTLCLLHFSGPVGYGYSRDYKDMTSTYQSLLKDSNLRILIYNGDTDMACNFLGAEWFVNSLNLTEKRSRKPWYVDGQVAGFAREFEKLTYTTIRVSSFLWSSYHLDSICYTYPAAIDSVVSPVTSSSKFENKYRHQCSAECQPSVT